MDIDMLEFMVLECKDTMYIIQLVGSGGSLLYEIHQEYNSDEI